MKAPRTPRRFVWLLAVCVGAVLIVVFFLLRSMWSADALVREGRVSLAREDPAAALRRRNEFLGNRGRSI
jgi:hypothetical protein